MSKKEKCCNKLNFGSDVFLVIVLIMVDQISKWWMMGQGRVVWNMGGVWGLLPGVGWTVLAGVLCLGFLVIFINDRNRGVIHWGLGLIVAAGMANLLDRLVFGAVRDFIYYPLLGVYGNLADIFLGAGMAMMVAGMWQAKKLDKGKQAQ